MTQPLPRTRRAWAAVVLAVAALGLAACSSGDGGSAQPAATTAVAARPSSPARLAIETPRNGQTVRQARPEVRLELTGA